MKNILLILTVFIGLDVNAQLPDGSTAPDFTLDDIVDSNTYNLYSYLDQGKTCFVEIFAAHCPSCWGYHQTETLKNLYNTYGPEGTDEVMVFALEYDEYNHYDAFIGNGPAWVTAGNWLDGTPYPIFQVEGGDRSVFVDYDVTFYPVVYMVCPNKVLKRVPTSWDAQQLYDGRSDCSFLEVEEEILSGKVYIDVNKNLVIENYQDVESVQILNLQGQVVQAVDHLDSQNTRLDDFTPGVYLFSINTVKGTVLKRFPVLNQ